VAPGSVSLRPPPPPRCRLTHLPAGIRFAHGFHLGLAPKVIPRSLRGGLEAPFLFKSTTVANPDRRMHRRYVSGTDDRSKFGFASRDNNQNVFQFHKANDRDEP